MTRFPILSAGSGAMPRPTASGPRRTSPGSAGSREALPALIGALDDEDGKVREAAAQAIGNMGPDALPALAAMLTHHDKYVRRNAVWAMGKLGPLARPVLADLCRMKNADPRTASGAAQALGNMGRDAAEAVPRWPRRCAVRTSSCAGSRPRR